MKTDVFICHSSKDAEIANLVCSMLEKDRKIKCWIAPRNIVGGKLYAQEIIDAIEGTQVFVLIFSSNANMSNHVLSELNCAFNAGKIILPFCIDDSEMSSIISYYANTSQSVIGHPEPKKAFDSLREAILRNIPSLQKDLEQEHIYKMLSEETGLEISRLKNMIKGAQLLSSSTKSVPYISMNDFDLVVSYASEEMEEIKIICKTFHDLGFRLWDSVKNLKTDIPTAKQICQAMEKAAAYLCVHNGNTDENMQRTADIALACKKPMFLCYSGNCIKEDDFTKMFDSNNRFSITNQESLTAMIKCLKGLCSLDNEEENMLNGTDIGAGRYDILQNAEGEILIIMDWKDSAPENPRLVYDGGEEALVYRNRESAFMLRSIASEARSPLMNVDEVLMVEIENDDVAREYKIPVRKVRSLKALS